MNVSPLYNGEIVTSRRKEIEDKHRNEKKKKKISKYPEKLSKYLAIKIVNNEYYNFDSEGAHLSVTVVLFQFHGICHRFNRSLA